MTPDIKVALIGVIAALLGAWAGAAISRRVSFDIIRRQEFNAASSEFRESFVEEQRILYSAVADRAGEHMNADQIISRGIVKHEHAIIKFKPFVRRSDTEAYEKAWENYAGDSRHFEKYIPNASLDRPVKWKLLLKNMEQLLEFAKYKH